MKRSCVISSPVATQSGYGHHAREVITNFIEQRDSEWDIKLLSMPWGSTPFTYPLKDDLIQRIVPLPLREQPDIWVQITIPNEFQPVGKYNIGVTALTEGDICKKEWVESVNKMNLIIVPSQFTKDVLIKSAEQYKISLITNIQVISEYFNESVYNKKNTIDVIDELDDIHESFCFLFVGHWLQGQVGEDRKNVTGLIHTFLHTFKNSQKMPALILKTSGATYSITDRVDIEKKINEIRDMFGKSAKLPNIYLLHGDLSDNKMNSLYNHKKIKSMVSFTKAEGFGRPLLEFSTTGKPIIAPVYSGQKDFLEHVVALQGGLTEVHPSARNEWIIEGAKWFTPDYNFAKKALKQVYKHYNKYLPFSKEQKNFVEQHFTKTAVSEQYKEVLKIISLAVNQVPKETKLELPKLNLPKLNTSTEKFPKLEKA